MLSFPTIPPPTILLGCLIKGKVKRLLIVTLCKELVADHAEAEERTVLPDGGLQNTPHRNSWPCLSTRAKRPTGRRFSHPKFASSPEKLDALGDERTSQSGHALSNLPGLRPPYSCPVSLRMTREDLSHWFHGTSRGTAYALQLLLLFFWSILNRVSQ